MSPFYWVLAGFAGGVVFAGGIGLFVAFVLACMARYEDPATGTGASEPTYPVTALGSPGSISAHYGDRCRCYGSPDPLGREPPTGWLDVTHYRDSPSFLRVRP